MRTRVAVVAAGIIGVLLLSAVHGVDRLAAAPLLNATPGMRIDVFPYVLIEQDETQLPSRRWVAETIRILKADAKVTPPQAAQVVALVASAYADALDATDDTAQAELVASDVLLEMFPEHRARIAAKQDVLAGDHVLTPQAEAVRSEYRELLAAGIGETPLWRVDPDTFSAEPPPKPNSFTERIEIEKMTHAIAQRQVTDEEAIFFWDGMTNFFRFVPLGQERVPLAGMWQNMLYVHAGDYRNLYIGKGRRQGASQIPPEALPDDRVYAEHQKVLAQSIADALAVTWRLKTMHKDAPRPSMRIPALDAILPDPKYSGYISAHAAAAGAAEATLRERIPTFAEVWSDLSHDAQYSRLLGGVNFEAELLRGERLGRAVAASYTNAAPPMQKPASGPVLLARIYARGLQNWITGLSHQQEEAAAPPAFLEVSEEKGLAQSLNYGAAWGDYNNDGWLDLITARGLYRNDAGRTFVHQTSVPSHFGTPGYFGDYNNDGCSDVYVVRAGEMASLDEVGWTDRLYRNNCDGTFTDVSAEAGIVDTYHGVSAAWADYDNDGDLDIYVLNRGILLGDGLDDLDVPYRFQPNVLYRNEGDGTFTAIENGSGADGLLNCPTYIEDPNGLARKMKIPFQPAWLDYNNDGWLDLYVVSDSYTSPLYKNNGDGTFTEVTYQAGLCAHPRKSNMGVAIGDYNNDGWLDLYVPNAGDNFLWQNNGDGTFTDIAPKAGANNTGYGWGAEALDYNNDGWLDIFVVNGNNRIRAKYHSVPELRRDDIDVLFRNLEGTGFAEVGAEEGISQRNEVTYTTIVGDYNNDGFTDIFVPVRGERHIAATSVLYENQPNENHWAGFRLIGTTSNRDAVGARIIVDAGDMRQMREVRSGSSYVAQSTTWPIIGLGQARTIDTLTIRWPSGLEQRWHNVPADRYITITEGEDHFAE